MSTTFCISPNAALSEHWLVAGHRPATEYAGRLRPSVRTLALADVRAAVDDVDALSADGARAVLAALLARVD
jgi:hypothetical protein